MGKRVNGRKKKDKVKPANQADRLLLKMTTLSLTGFRLCHENEGSTVNPALLNKNFNGDNLY